MVKIFFDCEFSSLNQYSQLLSIGLVSENGDEFYAEVEYDPNKIHFWVKENVLPKLNDKKLTRNELKSKLNDYFAQFDEPIEMWGDVPHYDWVHFCEIYGGALNLPENIYYICFDIATLFKVKGLDPDVDREKYLKTNKTDKKHNALWDAQIAFQCYYKLIGGMK